MGRRCEAGFFLYRDLRDVSGIAIEVRSYKVSECDRTNAEHDRGEDVDSCSPDVALPQQVKRLQAEG